MDEWNDGIIIKQQHCVKSNSNLEHGLCTLRRLRSDFLVVKQADHPDVLLFVQRSVFQTANEADGGGVSVNQIVQAWRKDELFEGAADD